MKTCSTKYCRKKCQYKYCSTCRSRFQKKNNPFKYYYDRLRCRAKERGKPFDLAFEQFMLIWLCEPEKWKEKLKKKECKWQMDRIRNHEGYHFDNIQIISKVKNIQKYYNEDRKFEVSATWIEHGPNHVDGDCPF